MPSNRDHITISLGPVTAGMDDVAYVAWPHAVKGRVDELWFVPNTSVTANNTNYCDVSVEVDATEIASEQTKITDTGDLTKGTKIEFAITGTGTSLEVSQGSEIALKFTHAGSGVAIGGTLSVGLVLDKLGS